jgi:hypothetical protein
LIFKDGAGVSGGSNASHVEGPVKKIGNDIFVFPTGNLGKWARIGLATAPSNATTEYTAEYVNEEFSDLDVDGSLDHVSTLEYWHLLQAVNDDDVKVTLYWENATASGISDCADLEIAHYDGTTDWNEEPATTLTGASCSGSGSGSIETDAIVTDYSPFGFGSKAGANALPVELLVFNGNKEDKYNYLYWSTASEVNSRTFELQRSIDGENFETITNLDGQGNSSVKADYTFDDYQFKGQDYYRLKQLDFNGEYDYSGVIYLDRNNTNEKDKLSMGGSFNIFPNPAKSKLNVNMFTDSDEPVEITIVDALGKECYKTFEYTNEGMNTYSVNIKNFSRGVYYINANTLANRYQGKFVKID